MIRYVNVKLMTMFIIVVATACTGGGESTLDARQSVFAVTDDDEISRIDIRDNDVEISLSLRESGQWVFNDTYTADEVAVANLLTVLKAITVVTPVSLADRQAVVERLNRDGTYVDVFANRYLLKLPGNVHLFRRQKQIRSFIVGGLTQAVNGNYVCMQSADQPFVVHLPGYTGDIRLLFSRAEHRWLDPVIVDYAYDKIRRVEVDVPDKPEESFTLVNDMVLGYRLYDTSGEVLAEHAQNTGLIERYLYAFEGLYYEEMIVDEASSEWQDIQGSSPFIIITITDTGGLEKTLRCYRRKLPEIHNKQLLVSSDIDPDRFFIKVDDDRYVLAQYMVFNRILRTLSFFTLPS